MGVKHETKSFTTVHGQRGHGLKHDTCIYIVMQAKHSFLMYLQYALFVVIFKPLAVKWVAKIGKIQVELQRLYFDMFYWTRYHCHDNTAGNKPALNNGFHLFSENSVVRLFPSFVPRKLKQNTDLLTLVP